MAARGRECVVGVEIEREPRMGKPDVDHETGFSEPCRGVLAESRDEASVDARFDRMEEEARRNQQTGRLPPASLDAKRTDERTIQTVALPHDQKQQWHDLERKPAAKKCLPPRKTTRKSKGPGCQAAGQAPKMPTLSCGRRLDALTDTGGAPQSGNSILARFAAMAASGHRLCHRRGSPARAA